MKTTTQQKTQTEALRYIKSLYDTGCIKLFRANEMDRAVFETNLEKAITLGETDQAYAAPDLLASCRALVLALKHHDYTHEGCEVCAQVRAARLAIARATGGGE